ncbi:MAG: hypothetical protein KDD33_04170 [Bdellovibrionales bacterium]|nr:hypothetical protein [Bdellovibrionales bacterium]
MTTGKKVFLGITSAVFFGLLIFTGLLWYSLKNKPCIGLSSDEIQNFSLPEVSVFVSELNQNPLKSLTPEEKQKLVSLLRGNLDGWSVSWHTPRAHKHSFHFQMGKTWLAGVGAGHNFLAKGDCQKDLSPEDQKILQSLIEQ